VPGPEPVAEEDCMVMSLAMISLVYFSLFATSFRPKKERGALINTGADTGEGRREKRRGGRVPEVKMVSNLCRLRTPSLFKKVTILASDDKMISLWDREQRGEMK
jgi:hypothetical protein